MSYTIIKPKSHQEWLNHRASGIGSSEVATIMGLNPFETPLQLWRKKMGIDAPTPENFAMRAGHYLEDAVSKFYADETGKEIIKSSAGDWIIQSNETPYLRVSPDRTFWLPDRPKSQGNKGILECKTTQKQVDADNVPMHWFCQLQYQLGVAEMEQGALAWLTMGREFGYRDFAFDREFYTFMVEQVTRFWVDNIKGKREPDPVNIDDILTLYPHHVENKTKVADWDIIDSCRQLKELKEDLTSLTTRKDELESDIKIKMCDAELLVTEQGVTLASWKNAKNSTKFNTAKFAKEHPDLYNDYLITAPGSRRFLLK